MKYECKEAVASAFGDVVRFVNTPMSCVTEELGTHVLHPGLNLTADGEWIPAPGFESRGTADRGEVETLRCIIRDLSEQSHNRLERAERAEAKLYAVANQYESYNNGSGTIYNLTRAIGAILRGEP